MIRRKPFWTVCVYCLLTAAVCLAICSKSSFLYPINDWTDANAYLSCGKGMLAGRVMYRDLYEHKGPLLYALHAGCAVLDSSSFLGVFVMEVIAFAAFLAACYKLLTLYGVKRAAYLALPVIGALVLSSFSFQQGDSAEELCLSLFAWSLYGLLKWLKRDAPARMAAKQLVLQGALFGCVLWMKFTMLGFYVPLLAGLLVYHVARREWRSAFSVLGWFAMGAALATLPWLFYFGLNGALVPWLKTYVYDNVFLSQDDAALSVLDRIKAMLRSGWNWILENWAYTVPMLAGMAWLCISKPAVNKPVVKSARHETQRAHQSSPETEGVHFDAEPASTVNANPETTATASVAAKKPQNGKTGAVAYERWLMWAMFAFTALGVFVGGKSYVYYGLILAAFMPLGLVPFCLLAERLPTPKPTARVALLCATLVAAGVFCVCVSLNTPDLLKPRDQTMQYRIAAFVRQTPNPTLLNYGFMDAGFYTACGIAPSVKYFHQTNVHLQQMFEEQERYVAQGITDYVVTRGRQPDSIALHYDLIATEDAPETFWYDRVYLYRRRDLAP